MHANPLLGPVITLVAWTLVMLFWMAAARLPKLKGRRLPKGARGADLEAGPHNWPAHNYMHLVEQPTVFYAVALALVAMGDTAIFNLYLAWAYVILRVLHSLWQATVNVVNTRFLLFLLSSLCLVALTLHAALIFIHNG